MQQLYYSDLAKMDIPIYLYLYFVLLFSREFLYANICLYNRI